MHNECIRVLATEPYLYVERLESSRIDFEERKEPLFLNLIFCAFPSKVYMLRVSAETNRQGLNAAGKCFHFIFADIMQSKLCEAKRRKRLLRATSKCMIMSCPNIVCGMTLELMLFFGKYFSYILPGLLFSL